MSRLIKAIVVEDDPQLSKLFSETLRRDPLITSSEAHNLPDAIKLCQLEPQVVLLVDLGIPGASGVDAVVSLRKEAPGATLVVITGNDHLMEDALNAGAHAVIIKSSPESKGAGLIKAIRDAVIAHELELLFAPTKEVVAKQTEQLTVVKDTLGTMVKNQK